jgi:nicotinamidase-related amidase/type 1 glutamine amidotransferase
MADDTIAGMPSRRNVVGGIVTLPLATASTAPRAEPSRIVGGARLSMNALALRLRARREVLPGSGRFALVEEPVRWETARTAVIVVDMWDVHTSPQAARRVGELAPRVNQVVEQLRRRGGLVIHAPSDCMDAYAAHPARKRALAARRSPRLPNDIGAWCRHLPSEDPIPFPVDRPELNDDDPSELEPWRLQLAAAGRRTDLPWRVQHAAIRIDPGRDLLSDRGEEIWNALDERRIEHVLLLGVHTNICVLGRPFGLRQLVKHGRQAVLVRDLTDTIYSPAARPFVSHFTGTDLVIEHIERAVAPSVTSDQLLGDGAPFRFRADRRMHVVMIVDEDEYETWRTLPAFAAAHLGGWRTTFLHGRGGKEHDIPGMDAVIPEADVILVSVRRRFPLAAQLEALRRHVAAGKGVVGIRTASHAFALRQGEPPAGHAAWNEWDGDILGGHYVNHHGAGPVTRVTAAPGAEGHALLAGVDTTKLLGHGTLYRVSPLRPTARPLLIGSIANQPSEPVAYLNVRADGGRSFYTSLGHPRDFEDAAFTRLLGNALAWAAGA